MWILPSFLMKNLMLIFYLVLLDIVHCIENDEGQQKQEVEHVTHKGYWAQQDSTKRKKRHKIRESIPYFFLYDA